MVTKQRIGSYRLDAAWFTPSIQADFVHANQTRPYLFNTRRSPAQIISLLPPVLRLAGSCVSLFCVTGPVSITLLIFNDSYFLVHRQIP
jgi:hypothetical protein